MRRRILRRQLIGAKELFGEPAWEMLIDLFIHEGEGRPLSTSDLCVTSTIPMSSALRLVQKLCDAGLVDRTPDLMDAVMLNTPCPAFITTSVMEGQSITNCYAQSLCASDETGESFFT